MSSPARRTTRDRSGLVVVLGFLALGILGAVLWWRLVHPAAFTVTTGGGGSMAEDQLGRRFDADGWYVVIAAVAGLVGGALAVVWRADRRPLSTTVLTLLGAALAAAVMQLLGRWLGPGDPSSVLASAPVGATVPTQLTVTGSACYLVWPIAALVGAAVSLLASAGDPAR